MFSSVKTSRLWKGTPDNQRKQHMLCVFLQKKKRRGAAGEVARGGDQWDLKLYPFEYLTPLSSGSRKGSLLFHVYETNLDNRWRRI